MKKTRYTTIWHERYKSWGGLGHRIIKVLRAKGVKASAYSSPYQHHIAVQVPVTQQRAAMRIIKKEHSYAY